MLVRIANSVGIRASIDNKNETAGILLFQPSDIPSPSASFCEPATEGSLGLVSAILGSSSGFRRYHVGRSQGKGAGFGIRCARKEASMADLKGFSRWQKELLGPFKEKNPPRNKRFVTN